MLSLISGMTEHTKTSRTPNMGGGANFVTYVIAIEQNRIVYSCILFFSKVFWVKQKKLLIKC